MLSFFQKKDKTTPIFVSKSALESPDHYELVQDIAEFWTRYSHEGFIRPTDLPDGVYDVSCALDYYGRVLNGGHAQCLENSDFETRSFDNIARVLRESGNHPMLSIFDRFRKLVGPTPDKTLTKDTTALEELGALDLQTYDLQGGEFDFYLKTHNWIRDDWDIEVKPADDIESFQKTFPSSLPGFHDFKLGTYLAPHVQSLCENDLGFFQAAASGMRVNNKPILITRVTEAPRPQGASTDVVRFFNLTTNIGKMRGIQTRSHYAICQRTGAAPNFDKTLEAGTGDISDLRTLVNHAQRHDPALIAHLMLDRGEALSGLKHISFYYPNHFGPEPRHDSMSYLVETRQGRLFRMDVSDQGAGLCNEGEDNTALTILRGREFSRKMQALRRQYDVYATRRAA